MKCVASVTQVTQSIFSTTMAGYLLQGCQFACTAPCRACSQCCVASCHAFDSVCGGITHFICPPNRASPVFLTYTLALNGVTGAFAVAAAAAHFQNDCDKQLHVWLLVQALVFNLFFTLFAARIHYVYNAPDTLAERQLPARSIDRALQICWWEPVVLLFAFAWPAALAWSVTGLTWAADSAHARHGGLSHHCSRSLIHFTRVSAVVMVVFLLTCAAVAALGCCCQSLFTSFQTADEENAAFVAGGPVGRPSTLPGEVSTAPQQSFLSSLLHPQRQFQQPVRPDYESLPPGNVPPPRQQFDPRSQPPPSGATPSVPYQQADSPSAPPAPSSQLQKEPKEV